MRAGGLALKLRFRLLALALCAGLAFPAVAQTQTGVSPTPPAGASPPYAPLGGCVYMPNGVALTGYVGPMGLTCGANGGLNVNVLTGGGGGGGGGTVTQGTSPWVDNITQWASVALGAPTAYGTAPTGVVPGVNSFVTNFPATQAVTWTGQTVSATQSGTWNVGINNFPTTQAVNNAQVNGVAIATGSGASNTGTQRVVLSSDSAIANTGFNAIGVYNSTAPTLSNGNTSQLQLDASANLKILATNVYSAAAGTNAGVATAVQGVTGGVPVPTTDTNAANTIASPGTAGTKSQSIQGGGSGSVPVIVSPTSAANAAGNPFFVQGTAGTAILGKVTTDQTTHGTTDKVAADLYVGGNANAAGNPIFAQLTAGTAIIGKFGIDQTTPGTTNAVAPNYYYDASSSTLGSSTFVTPRTDNKGNTRTSETGSADPLVGIVPNSGTGSTCTTTTATTGCIVSTASNNLYRVYASAPTAPSAQQYLVCINAAAVPAANAAFPDKSDYAPFNTATTIASTATINFGSGPPSNHASGTTCVISTSLTNYVAGTASIINASVR